MGFNFEVRLGKLVLNFGGLRSENDYSENRVIHVHFMIVLILERFLVISVFIIL